MYDCELDIASGDVLHEVTDVHLISAVPVEITRRYVSSSSATAGVFGHGWRDNLVSAVAFRGETIVHIDSLDGDTPTDLAECDGRSGPALGFFETAATVPRDFAGLTPDVILRQLALPPRREVLARRYPDGRREIFLPPMFGDDRWRLFVSSDPYGNANTYRYSTAGLLLAIRTADDREVHIDYAAHRVSGISVHDVTAGDRTLSWTRFTSDAPGDLMSTADYRGISYHYDYVDHLLVQFRGPNGLVKYFVYDSDRRCVASWLEGGRRFRRLDRDALRHEVLAADSYGRRALFRFDEHGNLAEHVDPLGQITARVLDRSGAVLATIAPDGGIDSPMRYDAATRTLLDFAGGDTPWRRSFDERGRLVRVESPAGTVQTFDYDEHGELTRIVFANGGAVEYFYDDKGEPAGLRDPNGYEVRRDTSAGGRTVRLRDSAGVMFLQTFDAMDNLLSDVDEGGRVTRYTYRAVDVVAAETGPSGETTRYDYDNALNLAARTTPLGHTWRIESNDLRQVVAEVDPTGGRVTYHYDREGNLAAVVNERGDRMEIARDALYREIGVRHFDSHVVRYEVDAQDRRTAIIDARGRRTELEYSPTGNLVRRRFPDGTIEKYEQNLEGEYDAITLVPPPGSLDPERAAVFEHTALGSVAAVVCEDSEVRYNRDAAGHLVGIDDNLGGHTRYVLGTRYRVAEIEEGGRRILLRHLAGGEVAEIQFPNGLRHTFEYDGSGRLIARTTTAASGAVVTWRRWAYDADDQLVSMEDWRWGRFGYEYDAAGRLVRVTDANGQPVEEYRYDVAGNLVVSPLGGAAEFGPGNRLIRNSTTAFEHDADGNLIGRQDDTHDWRFSWDRDDQLEAVWRDGVEVARFEYDLTNRRRRRDTAEGSRRFLYETYTLRAEILPNGVVRHYISLPGLAVPIARWGEEGWFYFSYDQIGTPHEVFDDAGDLVATFHGQAFGGARAADGPGAASFELPFGFMGQYRDDAIELHYNHFRYYDPRHGRFIAQDPMGLAMGTNFYIYAPNPNNYVDLCGLGPTFECVASWTPCQKAYARQKIAAINAATKSRRVRTCTKCRANAQRRDFRSKRCGKNKIGRGRQIDHLHELQAGGPDRCCKNLRAIPKKFNNQLGKQVKSMLKPLAEGDTIMKIATKCCRSSEPCKPEDMAKLAQAPKTQEAKCTEMPLDDNC